MIGDSAFGKEFNSKYGKYFQSTKPVYFMRHINILNGNEIGIPSYLEKMKESFPGLILQKPTDEEKVVEEICVLIFELSRSGYMDIRTYKACKRAFELKIPVFLLFHDRFIHEVEIGHIGNYCPSSDSSRGINYGRSFKW